jgi:hypothetical protein
VLGQELEATVIEECDGGRLLLEMDSAFVEADAPGGLRPGQTIRLRVEQLQPEVVLQIIELGTSIDSEMTRLLRSHLPAGNKTGELLKSLRSGLAGPLASVSTPPAAARKLADLCAWIDSVVAQSSPPTAEMLARWARDGGLFYERKLLEAVSRNKKELHQLAGGDFKALLLAALDDASEAIPASLERILAAQLGDVESQQAVNILSQLESGAFQLQIPFSTASGIGTAALVVETDAHDDEQGGGGTREGYRLLVALDLENFGAMRVDAYVTPTELRVRFFVDNDASVRRIRQALPAFQENLLGRGYASVELGASPLADLPRDRQEKFAALAAGAAPAVHLLDVKI